MRVYVETYMTGPTKKAEMDKSGHFELSKHLKTRDSNLYIGLILRGRFLLDQKL